MLKVASSTLARRSPLLPPPSFRDAGGSVGLSLQGHMVQWRHTRSACGRPWAQSPMCPSWPPPPSPRFAPLRSALLPPPVVVGLDGRQGCVAVVEGVRVGEGRPPLAGIMPARPSPPPCPLAPLPALPYTGARREGGGPQGWVGEGGGHRLVRHTGRPSDINLPGWRGAKIRKLVPVGSSNSLHTEACSALGASDGIIHSRISHEAACSRAAANARRSPTSCPPTPLFPPALSPVALPPAPPGGAGWGGEGEGAGRGGAARPSHLRARARAQEHAAEASDPPSSFAGGGANPELAACARVGRVRGCSGTARFFAWPL